ncbi:MAG: dethiobiotin synthase [Rubripirellula sp.]
MEYRTPRRLFFAGTDTEVGKTYVTSLVAKLLGNQGCKVGVYKPVASGCQQVNNTLVAEDAVALWQAAGKPLTLEQVCPQRFEKALAPPQAAEAEGKKVCIDQLINGIVPWEKDSEVLLIEGAGGLFSPIADGLLNLDLAKQLNAQIILVAENRLGAIHQVIATCEAAKAHQCVPAGIFLSHPKNEFHEALRENPNQMERYSKVPILGTVPFGGDEQHVAGINSILK